MYKYIRFVRFHDSTATNSFFKDLQRSAKEFPEKQDFLEQKRAYADAISL